MKWLILIFIILTSLAAVKGPSVDKIQKMTWDGRNYTVNLQNFQKMIKISGKNAVVPCLENAARSNMEVLIIIDSDIPMIKSCKLYSGSQPATGTPQAEETKNRIAPNEDFQ